MGSNRFDVVVVGAGVAGLACARALARGGARVRVLEARQRIGGRIATLHDARAPTAIELGAEFLHGEAPATHAIARDAGLVVVDVGEQRVVARRGRVERVHDYWQHLDRVLRRLDRVGADDDVSFAAFLDAVAAGGHDKDVAREFVEGFFAVDVGAVSAHALQGASPGRDPQAQRMARVVGGYDGVVAALVDGADGADGVDVVCGAVVDHIDVDRGVVSGDFGRVGADAVVVTVPIGVLQSGRLVVDPLPARVADALAGFGMASVVRVPLLFRRPFWTEHAALATASFVHTDDDDFPIFWTSAPVQAPLLVAWAGGRRAARLSRLPVAARVDRALAALARALGRRRRDVDADLVAAYVHDWGADRFCGGAYSFVRVSAGDPAAALAGDHGGRLWFAGEATAPGGQSGTVDGAIDSGHDVAHRLLRR